MGWKGRKVKEKTIKKLIQKKERYNYLERLFKKTRDLKNLIDGIIDWVSLKTMEFIFLKKTGEENKIRLEEILIESCCQK